MHTIIKQYPKIMLLTVSSLFFSGCSILSPEPETVPEPPKQITQAPPDKSEVFESEFKKAISVTDKDMRLSQLKSVESYDRSSDIKKYQRIALETLIHKPEQFRSEQKELNKLLEGQPLHLRDYSLQALSYIGSDNNQDMIETSSYVKDAVDTVCHSRTIPVTSIHDKRLRAEEYLAIACIHLISGNKGESRQPTLDAATLFREITIPDYYKKISVKKYQYMPMAVMLNRLKMAYSIDLTNTIKQ